MYCEECQVNLATIHLTQNIQGEITESHLCESCAVKKGSFLFDVDSKFSIPNLLSNFFGYNYNISGSKTASPGLVCPNCNMNFNDIRRTGKLGCSECYTAFAQVLEPSLRRIHGNSRHIGRVPLRGGGNVLLQRKINELKDKLQKAVVNEEYESAAEIRDEIKKLEKDLA